MLQEIIPVLNPAGDDYEEIDKYGVSLYLFNDISSECYKYQYADNFKHVKPFIAERAAYSLVALMVGEESANLYFKASKMARQNDSIRVIDMNEEIPDIVLGTVSVKQVVTAPVAISQLNRIVGSFDIELQDVSQEITRIEATVSGLYDMIDFQGDYGFSKGTPATKKITLKSNGNTFSNRSVIFPSDVKENLVKVIFRVFRGTQYEDFTVGLSGKILPDQVAQLKGKAEDILKNGQLTLQLTYAPWKNSSVIEDNIIIEDDLNKKWNSKPLPIGGRAGAGYDNFWASSSLVNDWAKLYDSYLYDGIKDIEHKDEYWGPDIDAEASAGTIPGWYIDLGAPKEGITITYWNKFGGAGGQKIRTMDIYGSNTKDDYEGGNTNWTLIDTFTSDKTTPTVDAGAEVTTGRITFNEGNNSYRYIKCAITSRVNNTGNVVMDSDVNVSEVEIIVWSCK